MDEHLTGLDLKIERVRAGLMVLDVAKAMGISSSRVSRIESPDYRVTPRMLARYRAALGTYRTPEKAA